MPYTYNQEASKVSKEKFKGYISSSFARPLELPNSDEERKQLMLKEAVIATANERIKSFKKFGATKNSTKFEPNYIQNNYCAIAFIKNNELHVVPGESKGSGLISHAERIATKNVLRKLDPKNEKGYRDITNQNRIKKILEEENIREYVLFSERAPCPYDHGCDKYLRDLNIRNGQVFYAVKAKNLDYEAPGYEITGEDKVKIFKEQIKELAEFLNFSFLELQALYALSSPQNKPSINNTSIQQENLEDAFECQKKLLAESLQTSKQQPEQFYSKSPSDNILMEDELPMRDVIQKSDPTKHQDTYIEQQQGITARPSINKGKGQHKTNPFKIDLPIKKYNPHKDRKEAQAAAARGADKSTTLNPQSTGQQVYQKFQERQDWSSKQKYTNKSATPNPQSTGQQVYQEFQERQDWSSKQKYTNKSATPNPQSTGQQVYQEFQERQDWSSKQKYTDKSATPNPQSTAQQAYQGYQERRDWPSNKTPKKTDNFLTVAATANIHKDNRTEKINPQNEDNNQTFPSPS